MVFILLKKDKFIADVEKHVLTERVTYIEAVLVACEDYGITPEGVKSLIPQPIKEKMEAEFQELNLLPKDAKLPI